MFMQLPRKEVSFSEGAAEVLHDPHHLSEIQYTALVTPAVEIPFSHLAGHTSGNEDASCEI